MRFKAKWLLVAGAALILGYELWAALSHHETISQMVWRLPTAAVFFLVLGIGVLLVHLFIPGFGKPKE